MVGMYVALNKKQTTVYYVLLSIENLLYETFTIRPIEKIYIFYVLTLSKTINLWIGVHISVKNII